MTTNKEKQVEEHFRNWLKQVHLESTEEIKPRITQGHLRLAFFTGYMKAVQDAINFLECRH